MPWLRFIDEKDLKTIFKTNEEPMTDLTVQKTDVANFAPKNNIGGVEVSDMQIPSIILVQKMSKVVDSHNATPGSLWDMLENKKLGDEQEALEIIPLAMQKSWIVYDVTDPKNRIFLKVEQASDQNQYAYRDNVDGKQIERSFSMNWLVLLKKQVALGEAMPYRISFKSSSLTAAKKLATMVARSAGKFPVYGRTYFLTSKKESNDKGTYYTFDVEPGEVCNQEAVDVGSYWASVVQSGKKAEPETLPFETVEADPTPF